MGKLDELKRDSGGNAAESLGVGVTRGQFPGNQPGASPEMPARLRGVTKAKNAAEIELGKVQPDPGQPREVFDEEALGRLAESLRSRGQLQPIRVRWDEPAGVYKILCGERRWRAAGMAGLATVSCVVVEGPVGPGELLAMQVVENALREDLKPVEQARAFRALMDFNGWSTHQVARELSVTQSAVVKSLALLELPAEVQERVERGELAAGTAYEVSRVADPEEQRVIAEQVVAEKLTRQEAVEAIRRGRGAGPAKSRTHEFEVAKGCTVLVRYRGEPSVDLVKALRLAAKLAAAAGGIPGESPQRAA